MNNFVPVCGLRQCRKCQEIKPDEEFSFRNRIAGLRVAQCKTCVRIQSNTWYANNKDRHREVGRSSRVEWVSEKREENKRLVANLKSGPCTDCGEKHPPWVMQFDHRDPFQKRDNIATLVHNARAIEVILEEIGKCDLVCSNCHANRTHLRRTNQWQ